MSAGLKMMGRNIETKEARPTNLDENNNLIARIGGNTTYYQRSNWVEPNERLVFGYHPNDEPASVDYERTIDARGYFKAIITLYQSDFNYDNYDVDILQSFHGAMQNKNRRNFIKRNEELEPFTTRYNTDSNIGVTYEIPIVGGDLCVRVTNKKSVRTFVVFSIKLV